MKKQFWTEISEPRAVRTPSKQVDLALNLPTKKLLQSQLSMTEPSTFTTDKALVTSPHVKGQNGFDSAHRRHSQRNKDNHLQKENDERPLMFKYKAEAERRQNPRQAPRTQSPTESLAKHWQSLGTILAQARQRAATQPTCPNPYEQHSSQQTRAGTHGQRLKKACAKKGGYSTGVHYYYCSAKEKNTVTSDDLSPASDSRSIRAVGEV